MHSSHISNLSPIKYDCHSGFINGMTAGNLVWLENSLILAKIHWLSYVFGKFMAVEKYLKKWFTGISTKKMTQQSFNSPHEQFFGPQWNFLMLLPISRNFTKDFGCQSLFSSRHHGSSWNKNFQCCCQCCFCFVYYSKTRSGATYSRATKSSWSQNDASMKNLTKTRSFRAALKVLLL